MARPIEHITTIISADPQKTYEELLAPPKHNPARDRMVQRVKAFAREQAAEAEKKRSRGSSGGMQT